MGACASKEQEAQASQPAPPAADDVKKPSPTASTSDQQQPTDDPAAWAYRGAPRPPNEAERLGLLRALGVLDSEQGPDQFDAITRLLCGVFNVPIALVSLVDAERQWFKSVQGLGNCMQTGREESFCAWTLLPESPYVLIVEDALEDKRFRENPLVVGEPHIRFYAGAPLISSANGYRYGTLCVIDNKPHREFAAEAYNLLIQFAELCVREIEKDKLTMLQKAVQQTAAQGSDGGGGLTPLESLRSSAAGSLVTPPTDRSLQAASQHGGLTRAADCFREGVLLLDAGTPDWTVLYTNDACMAVSGVPRQQAVSRGFWELFGAQGQGPATFKDCVDAGEAFTTTVSLLTPHRDTPKLTLVDFRPAATGQLGGHTEQVGIPANAVSASLNQTKETAPGLGSRYYFAILRGETRQRPTSLPSPGSATAASTPLAAPPSPSGEQPASRGPPSVGGGAPAALPAVIKSPAAAAGQASVGRASLDSERSLSSIPPFRRAMPSAFTDVRLGPLIGRGAYGRVYRGSWNGTTVAVKVMETSEPLEDDPSALAAGKSGIFEAVLSTNLSHPCIVHTYQYAFRPVTAEEQEERGSGGSLAGAADAHNGQNPKVVTEVWLVSEFCNRGPLLTAIERGAFLTQPSSQYGQPNLISVLQTLQEIAAALQYLHRNDVLHGDLTGGNVLLTASDKDTRGFTAKVVDFGLSRVCSGDYLRTRTLGCAEYMPPELITEGILTKAADVYAFGVITWEIYVGRRAWEGLKPTEVLRKVASNTRLAFPPQTPHRLKVLGERCMEYSPTARPTMEEVLTEVNSILSDTMGILQQFLAASSAAAMGGGGAMPGGGMVPDLPPSDPFK